MKGQLKSIYESIILEKSLSRVWMHIQNGNPFAVISAYRGSNTPDENAALHRQLKQDIQRMGYGVIEQKGGYTYTNPDTNEEGTVEEMSVFIPKISLDQAIELGKKYNQESIIYKDDNRFDLVDVNNGSTIMKFSKGSKEPVDFVKNPNAKVDRGITFNPEVLKYAFSQLAKARHKADRAPYAFNVAEAVYELHIPSRTDSMKSMKTGKLAESRWIRIL